VGFLEQNVLLENLKERDQSQNLDIDGKLTLKRTLKQDTVVEWTVSIWDPTMGFCKTYM